MILPVALIVLAVALGLVVSYHIGRGVQLSIDIPRMIPLCEETERFVWSELDPNTASKYRSHLKGCQRCQKRLREMRLMDTHLAELGVTLP